MRTLKKVLALSLALAMIFSLTAVAAYKDADKINADLTSDIDLLNALGVMQGDNNGNFNPQANITRAEAAKMMYVLKTNKTEAPTSFIGGLEAKKLNDIKGHWGESYISYCAEMGIVVGQGAGKFNPQGKVTGQELAKMLLLTVGYKAEQSGFFGPTWATKVTMVGSDVGLFDGYELAFSAPATREYAAKLFATAITDVAMVKYSKDAEAYEEQYVGKSDVMQTIGNKVFKVETVKGVLTGTDKLTLKASANPETSAKGEKSTITVGGAEKTFEFATSASLLQQEVTVVYKAGSSAGVDNAAKVYSVYPTGKSKVYNTTKDAITAKADGTAGETIKFKGYNDDKAKAYANGAKIRMVVNYTTASDVTVAHATVELKKAFASNDNFAVKFVDTDGNGTLDHAFVESAVYLVVDRYEPAKFVFLARTAANAVVENVSKESTFKDEFKFNSELVKGDVVKIVTDSTTGTLVKNVTKLDKVEGNVTKYTGGTVTVGGKEFDEATTVVAGYSSYPTTPSVENTAFYVNGGYVVYSTGAGATATKLTTNLAYIIGVAADVEIGKDEMGEPKKVDRVDVLQANGTRKVFDYEVPSSVKASDFMTIAEAKTAMGAATTKVVEYVMNGDSIYFRKAITPATGVTTNGTLTANGELNVEKATLDGKMVNADSYFFVVSTKDSKPAYAVMKMSEFKSNVGKALLTDGTTVMSGAVNGLPTVVCAVLELGANSVPGTEVAGTYAMVVGDKYSVIEDGKLVTKVAIVNNKNESLDVVLATGTQVVEKNKLYTITSKDSKVTFEAITVSTSVAVDKWLNFGVVGLNDAKTVISFADQTGGVATGTFYTINKDTKVWYVDADGKLVKEGTIAAAGWKDADNSGTVNNAEVYYKNALYRVNSDNVVTDLFVQVDGDTLSLVGTLS